MQTTTSDRLAAPAGWRRPWKLLLSPLLWLERAKGRRRILLALVYALLVASAVALAWRASRLRGLPDIGDPFDPGPMLTRVVPEERNAFALYEQASAKAKFNQAIENRVIGMTTAALASDPEARDYLARNREALELWRRGSERPEALYVPVKDMDFETRLPLVQQHRGFVRLALLEAARLRDGGDLAGAWGWYRAVLRGSRLIGWHGATIIQGLVGIAEYGVARGPISAWAADPKADADLLRRALAEVREIDGLSTPCSEALQVEYLSVMKLLDDPDRLVKMLLEEPGAAPDMDRMAWYNHAPAIWHARWFLDHEPERSKRLVRLMFANWLADCDRPRRDRPPMIGTKKHPRILYDAPMPAGALPAEALAREVEASPMAELLVPAAPAVVTAWDRDRAQRAGLIIELASKLYERERGKPPESADALVGAYLDRLPDGYARPDGEDGPSGREVR